MATVAVTLAFFATAVFWNTRHGVSEYILTAELARLDNVAEALAKAHDPLNKGWPEFVGDRMAFGEFVRRYLFSRPPIPRIDNSNPAGDSDPQRRGGRITMRERLALLDENKNLIVGPDLSSMTVDYFPVATQNLEGEEEVLGYLALGLPRLNQRARDLLFEQKQVRSLLDSALLALVLSILATLALTRTFVAPINELLKGAQKLSDRKLDTRLPVTRYDEMGELQVQFNNLAETLEANERSERQWISDTSHELQTPLAILRAEIEALEDGVRQADKDTLARLHSSVIRLSSLVKDISTLAQAREGAFAGALTDEDLSLTIRAAAQSANSLIAENGLSLELDIEPDLIVDCDRLRIGQLIDNLLSNSVRYTNAGGKIRLSVFRKRARVFIHCEDTLPCPPEESIGKLFGRFFRDDKSRSRKSGGSGLGLSICKAIVTAHRGQIHAERSELGGLKIVVALPIRNDEALGA